MPTMNTTKNDKAAYTGTNLKISESMQRMAKKLEEKNNKLEECIRAFKVLQKRSKQIHDRNKQLNVEVEELKASAKQRNIALRDQYKLFQKEGKRRKVLLLRDLQKNALNIILKKKLDREKKIKGRRKTETTGNY